MMMRPATRAQIRNPTPCAAASRPRRASSSNSPASRSSTSAVVPVASPIDTPASSRSENRPVVRSASVSVAPRRRLSSKRAGSRVLPGAAREASDTRRPAGRPAALASAAARHQAAASAAREAAPITGSRSTIQRTGPRNRQLASNARPATAINTTNTPRQTR